MSDVAASVEGNSEAVTITDAKAPFDSPDAEVIIRSSDNVDFRVFKAFLSSVSDVFKDMFALPQGPADVTRDDEEMRHGLPVIRVTEENRIVETLLMFCYPNILTSVPVLQTVDEILPMLEVAIKYGIEKLEKQLRKVVFSPPLVNDRAMQLFVVAYQHRWEKEIRIAAKYTLVQPAWGRLYVTELESITGGDLHRLQQYRLECVAAATRVATTSDWMKWESLSELKCKVCEHAKKEVRVKGPWGAVTYRPSSWWLNYMEVAAKELAKLPWGDTVMESVATDAALRQTHRCTSRTEKKFTEFCEEFAGEVDRAISEVCSKLSNNVSPDRQFSCAGHPGYQALRSIIKIRMG